ncbi:MAG TPA: PAS domain-containing sensor histidine kinase [Ktedonobacteraceae bacterium]|nr:PAS domain-containing sensor histidine kinase [Ktedonobacteraceae bacterium]
MGNHKPLGQAIVDALPVTIAVIEQDGTIRAVNEAWKRFAQENSGGRDVTSTTDVGVNYLEVCRKAQGAFAEEAPPALIGIQHVLQRELAHFQLEYPCHSPTEQRWFLMSVTPLEQDQGAVIAHLNITERKLAEETMQQSEARVRRLIGSNILGIFFWRGRQITEANEIFLHMLGYTRQELLIGKLLWNTITPKKFEELDRKAIATMKRLGALPVPYEKEFFRKDGSCIPILIGAAFVDQAQQEGVAFVLDISERKELERRKDDFFGMVSHELKTPLSNMWILTSLLNKQLTEQGFLDLGGNLVQLGTQAQQLMKLLTDVLEVSQLQAGYLLYREEAFDMNALVREIVSMLQQVSPDHAIVITGTTDKPMRGDRARLGQVLTNLLTNAMKYSEGADPIDVLLASTDEHLMIRVRDYGIGIPAQEQGKIFERFYRVKSDRQESFPGFGLGLHISQEIVKRHGGAIEVESVEEKGSTFTIMLPFQM